MAASGSVDEVLLSNVEVHCSNASRLGFFGNFNHTSDTDASIFCYNSVIISLVSTVSNHNKFEVQCQAIYLPTFNFLP